MKLPSKPPHAPPLTRPAKTAEHCGAPSDEVAATTAPAPRDVFEAVHSDPSAGPPSATDAARQERRSMGAGATVAAGGLSRLWGHPHLRRATASALLGISLLSGSMAPEVPTAAPIAATLQVAQAWDATTHPWQTRLDTIRIPSSAPAAQELGRRALQELPAPAADHPFATYVNDIRRELRARGLATSATGVKVYVVGEADPARHGGAVARAVAGPVGLGQGADIAIQPREARALAFRLSPAQQERATEMQARVEKMRAGRASLDDVVQAGLDLAEQVLHEKRRALAWVQEQHPAGTVLVNISWGQSLSTCADQITTAAQSIAAAVPRFRAELERAIGRSPSEDDIRAYLSQRLEARMQSNDGAGVRDARAHLGREVRAARDAGILVFNAAGNEHSWAAEDGDAAYSTAIASEVEGLVQVGAIDLGDPSTPADDGVASFSSAGGITVSTAGVDMPLRRGVDGGIYDTSGTSYAAPHLVGVAALMLAENPKLSPDDIETILQRAARDLPGTTRDGAGAVDAVRAVELARQSSSSTQS